MPLTGGWASKARVRPVPHTVRTVVPDHAATLDPDDATDWTAPPAPDYGVIGDDPWAADYVVVTAGAWGEQAPFDTPDVHSFNPGHAVDTGTLATLDAGTRGAMQGMEQYTDDNHVTPILGGLPSTIVRGINSRPENNPTELPREGQRVGRAWINRKFLRGDRVTDSRVTYVNTPWMQPGGPELDTVPDEPGRYSQPFNAWARGLNGGPARPSLRRTPTPVSDDQYSDGSDDVRAVDAPADSAWFAG